ncbi:YchJ family metal-binding protein [Curvibacter sp. APW13]|uniref:YchJ family protein n=1 Tax=Curvibacter sp. APW13 TaxID=3077236 RepID=UPI0028E0412C|nr:YchJ family metal-binding protein [Curvibacter sp. APW13]MDT8989729.1 YchJ family metal-binding protein [Curvibacter sp. APW13]
MAMKTLAATAPCPCARLVGRKPQNYGQCCGRFLDGDQSAPDAESLMRSRYSAFVLEREAYLLQTWHPSQRPVTVEFEPGVKWLGLEVRDAVLTDATHAEVEFVARQKPTSGAAIRLHERSRFVQEGGRWLYVDGDLRGA